MALLMGCGELDAEQRWPITKDPIELGDVTNISPLADRIEHVNNWHRAAGAVGGQETEESVKENAAGDEVSATTRFGIAFDKQWVDEYEGNYYMGDLFDANGDPRVRYMSIDALSRTRVGNRGRVLLQPFQPRPAVASDRLPGVTQYAPRSLAPWATHAPP